MKFANIRTIFGADLRSLALLRISLGVLVIVDLIDRARDLRAHYTDFGLLPRGPLVQKFMNELVVCLHLVTGTATGAVILFLLQALVALLLLMGWRTRLMAVLSWVLMYSLHLRNPMVLQGGDDLLRMLLFWAMFVPMGARYSVDAAMARKDPTEPFVPPPGPYFSVGTLALVVQVLLLYWCTALLKTGAAWHGEATAVYYALNYDQLATSFGVWLRQFTQILPWLTRATILFETFGPFLLIFPVAFGPVRTVGALMFMGMHHCFALCLLLGLFPWIDTASMLMLLPTWFWEQAEKLIPKAQKDVTIYFDDGCEVCRKLVLIVTEFLLVQRVPCQAVASGHAMRATMEKERSWLVQDTTGVHHGFAAFLALCRVSPVARPLCRLLAYPWPFNKGEKIYRSIADNRPMVARWLHGLRRGEAVHLQTPGWLSVVCLFLLYIVVAWNLAGLPASVMRYFYVGFPNVLRPTAYMLRLDQDWGMFAPFPATDDGWYVTPGKLVDGRDVSVYDHTVGAPSWDKPALVSNMYKNQRWSKYMMNIWLARNADYRLYLGQYFCRMWNGVEPQGPDKLATFDVTYVREDTLPAGKVGAPTRVVLWQHRCYDQVAPKLNMPPSPPPKTSDPNAVTNPGSVTNPSDVGPHHR